MSYQLDQELLLVVTKMTIRGFNEIDVENGK